MRPVRGGVELVGGGSGGHPARLWRTPTPYLFLGFAVMMGLIAVALFVLVCTRRKPGSSSRRGGGAGEAAAAAARVLSPLDREPPRVVVMPGGDGKLYFLASAKPLAVASAAAAAAPAGDGAV